MSGYLLRTGSHHPTLWRTDRSRFKYAIVHHPRREKLFDETENVAIGHPFGHRLHDDRMREVIEGNSYTLPITKNFLQASSSLDHTMPLKVSPSLYKGESIGKVVCICF
jgi:hypothetical protein